MSGVLSFLAFFQSAALSAAICGVYILNRSAPSHNIETMMISGGRIVAINRGEARADPGFNGCS